MKANPASYGFSMGYGNVQRVVRNPAHIHNEIELTWLERGTMWYLYGGKSVKIHEGQLTVFWAAIAHTIWNQHQTDRCYWINLPLEWVISWQLPTTTIGYLLQGGIIREPNSTRITEDRSHMKQWYRDICLEDNNDNRQIALLEIQARLRRLAGHAQLPDMPARMMDTSTEHYIMMTRLIRYIDHHLNERLSADQIAYQAGMNQATIRKLFKKYLGVSLQQYMLEQRVNRARRLLATTDQRVLDIAYESGFSTVSHFYDAFQRYTGRSPGTYRTGVQNSE